MKYTGLSGKKVLVTGGTRGIGYAIGEAFVEQDAVVHVSGTSKQGVGPSGTIYHACDFTSQERLEDLCFELKTLELDVLINNAGINKIEAFAEIAAEDYLCIQQVNLFAVFQLIQSVLPHMVKNQWGRIVNIASIFGIVSKECRASYSTSKFGMLGMTFALAAEVAKSGVLANCVSPGFIDTELTRKVLGEKGMDEIAEKVPLQRMGTPEEVARLVLWLASEENTFVSAQNIAIDGGFVHV
jgi:NAD(P)-dependent dehydrogenase (short-subunit alcohol dehydrogenase family)